MKGVKSFRVMKDLAGKTYKVFLIDILSCLKTGWDLKQRGIYLLSPDGQKAQYFDTVSMKSEIIRLLESNWSFGLTDERKAMNLEYARNLREQFGDQVVYSSTTNDLPFIGEQQSTVTTQKTTDDPMALKLLNMILSNNVSGLTITTLDNGLWSVSGKIHLS